ncbi:hypothetical protein M569_13961, partial [Genlisea aurea]
MDSGFNAVPRLATTTSKNDPDWPFQALGIRAPVTVDESDFGNGNTDCYSCSEIIDDDDDTETGFARGNSNVSSESEFLRIRVRNSEERIDEHYPDDDSVRGSEEEDDEFLLEKEEEFLRKSSDLHVLRSVDELLKKLQAPIARISSCESDADEEFENETVCHGNLQRLKGGALKVRPWESDEESETGSIVRMEDMISSEISEPNKNLKDLDDGVEEESDLRQGGGGDEPNNNLKDLDDGVEEESDLRQVGGGDEPNKTLKDLDDGVEESETGSIVRMEDMISSEISEPNNNLKDLNDGVEDE